MAAARLGVAMALLRGVIVPAPAHAATIADLAPRDALLLVSVDDYTAFREALARTAIAEFLHEPEVQDWFASFWTADAQTWRGETRDRGLDPDDLPRPAGAVGLAVWVDPAAASPMVAHTLLYAEMGADADLFERTLEALIGSAERDGLAESTEIDVAGIAGRRVSLPRWRVRLEGAARMLITADEFIVVRIGDAFLASTDERELVRALARLRGDAGGSLARRREYISALDHLGPAHLRLTLLAAPLLEALDRLARSDAGVESAGGTVYDAPAIAGALGLASVEAVSLGVTFDAPDAPLTAHAVVITPRKEGVLALFDAPVDGLSPKRAVPVSSLDVRQFGLRYERIIPMVLGLVDVLPERDRAQARAMVGFLTAAVGPLFQTLGPETVLARWRTEEASGGGQRGLFEARAGNEDAIAATLRMVGSLIGLKNRAEGAALVWTLGDSQALALDDGWLVIADRQAITAALAARPVWGEVALIESVRFQHAAARLTPGAVFYSYTNLVENARWTRWREDHWEDLLREDLRDLGQTAAEIERWVEDERAQRDTHGVIEWPDAETVGRHLGDAVAEVRSTPFGFEYRGWLLPPEPADEPR